MKNGLSVKMQYHKKIDTLDKIFKRSTVLHMRKKWGNKNAFWVTYAFLIISCTILLAGFFISRTLLPYIIFPEFILAFILTACLDKHVINNLYNNKVIYKKKPINDEWLEVRSDYFIHDIESHTHIKQAINVNFIESYIQLAESKKAIYRSSPLFENKLIVLIIPILVALFDNILNIFQKDPSSLKLYTEILMWGVVVIIIVAQLISLYGLYFRSSNKDLKIRLFLLNKYKLYLQEQALRNHK